MTRNRNKGKAAKGASAPVVPAKVAPVVTAKKHNPWAAIENGTADTKTAHQVFYKERSDETKVVVNDKRKKKKVRLSDGSEAVRMAVNQKAEPQVAIQKRPRDADEIISSAKRVRTDNRGSSKQDSIFSSMVKKVSNASGQPEVVDKKVNNEKVIVNTMTESDIIEIDIRPKKASTTSQIKKGSTKVFSSADGLTKTFPKKVQHLDEDLSDGGDMSGLESDEDLEGYDGLMEAVFRDKDDEDESVFDEELGIDEDEEEGMEFLEDEDLTDEDEMEDEEIDADEMTMKNGDIESFEEINGDDVNGCEASGGCCGNGVTECCEEDSDMDDEQDAESVLSEQDAESDEEGHLGELRQAGKMQTKGNKRSLPSMDFDVHPFTDEDSGVTSSRAMAWMISPCDTQTFFNDFYEANCLHISRKSHRGFYGNLFSTERFVELLEKNYVEYGTNINIAEYKHSVRKTMNEIGRVQPHHINRHLAAGRSVQLVNPQTFDDHIWYLCEILQETFGCFVGANTYLTPAGTSGFAPHWDEINAFLLQLEGKKYWKVYAPRSNDEELPRDSSGNFTEADMKGRKPTFEGWVEAGDMLYIPRGFIHQASTSPDVHSLHVTVSVGRQWAFVDLLDKMLPEAIQALGTDRMKIRRSLPIGLFDMGGVVDREYPLEENFEERFVAPLDRHMSMLRNFVADHCMEISVDIMAREFMKTALPPLLTPEEKLLSVIGSGIDVLKQTPTQFTANTEIKLIRRHGQRLIIRSDEKAIIATRMNNSRLYEGRPEQELEIPGEFAEAVIQLTESYPEWMRVSELKTDMDKFEQQELLSLLFNNCLLLVRPGKGSKKVKKSKK